MILLVSGSRSIRDIKFVYRCISEMQPFDSIIHGGASGVDAITEKYCKEHNVPCEVFPPDYEKFGKSAPIIRNTTMVRRADKILLVWDGVSRGTRDTLHKAKAQGKPFVLKRYTGNITYH